MMAGSFLEYGAQGGGGSGVLTGEWREASHGALTLARRGRGEGPGGGEVVEGEGGLGRKIFGMG